MQVWIERLIGIYALLFYFILDGGELFTSVSNANSSDVKYHGNQIHRISSSEVFAGHRYLQPPKRTFQLVADMERILQL